MIPDGSKPGDAPAPPSTSGRGQTVDWASHAESLTRSIKAVADAAVRAHLNAALVALAAQPEAAVRRGRAALLIHPSAVAWRLIGLGHEGLSENEAALEAFQSAYALEPESADILADLGRLARTLDLNPVAVEFFSMALAKQPTSPHLQAQLSAALRDSHEYGKAVGVLRDAIRGDPANAFLWNALAAVLLQQGDTETALIMADEALRLSPGWPEALFNRAVARLEAGQLADAVSDCDAAAAQVKPAERPAILFVRAQAKLAAGDLAGGWADYDARLDPDFANAQLFSCPGRRWTPGDDLSGARMLVIGEQGLGDEMMFAGMIPDLIQALGPDGRLTLAVAPRLVSLIQRSFPEATVFAHQTGARRGGGTVTTADVPAGDVDLWAPMGALARRFRLDPKAFGRDRGVLIPSPDETARWRRALANLDDRPKIGIAWKSMKTYRHRLKQYAPFADWAPLLRTPGVRFVNLQYGDCDAELEAARALGVEIWRPPGLDLTDDIDGAAALSGALDLVIGVGNASTNVAAAAGVETWFIHPRIAWPRLGTDRHPWFARTRVFAADRFGDWRPVLDAVAVALGAYLAERGRA